MFLKLIQKRCTLLTLVRQKNSPKRFRFNPDFPQSWVNEDCHWLFLQLFWKKLGNFRKNIGGLCGGPITLTYKGQQTTLRPWDPSRCLDAQSISWRFRAINTLSILSRKDVRRSLEKGPCAHFATKMGRFRGLPLQV